MPFPQNFIHSLKTRYGFKGARYLNEGNYVPAHTIKGRKWHLMVFHENGKAVIELCQESVVGPVLSATIEQHATTHRRYTLKIIRKPVIQPPREDYLHEAGGRGRVFYVEAYDPPSFDPVLVCDWAYFGIIMKYLEDHVINAAAE